MISDWTVYGYIGDGYAVCSKCVRDSEARYTEVEDIRAPGAVRDTISGERLDGLLSIADTSDEGLSCDDCGGYIFEPSSSYAHEQGWHEDHAQDCDACEAIAEQVEQWADEHDRGEHDGSPILHTVTVRNAWATAETRGGCPDCERIYAPAPGQLELGAE